jgi:hypothetical protein
MRTEADASCIPDYGGGGPTTLYSDDFESGSFGAGGWTIADSSRCKVTNGGDAKLKKGGKGTPACTVGTPVGAGGSGQRKRAHALDVAAEHRVAAAELGEHVREVDGLDTVLGPEAGNRHGDKG